MKIIIIGDGKVGHKVATELSEENYDIVLIDQNRGKLSEALNQMDIQCIEGNGADVDVQKKAGVATTDLVIACASNDETNMLSCLFARRLGAKHTIARVRNPIYYAQIDVLKRDLHLSMAVNPELAAANEIARLLLIPDTTNSETFMKGRVELVEFPIREENPLIGITLADLYQKYQIRILVCAIERGGDVIIPDGNTVMEKGDKIHIAASHSNLESFFFTIGRRKKIKKVLICGGGILCYYLTKQLVAAKMQVKIIEHKQARCEELEEIFNDGPFTKRVSIVNGDATDQELLLEEGIEEADALVALTGLDEENIIMGLFAKTLGLKKVITKVNEDNRAKMVEGLGIDSIISAKTATADVILGYVRARHNSSKVTNVETLVKLVDGKIEAEEFIIKHPMPFLSKPLKELPTVPDALISCIGRDRKVLIPDGNTRLEIGDSVVVVTKGKIIRDLPDIFVDEKYRKIDPSLFEHVNHASGVK
ncbi:MAG: Trk system potassium transporter TrkA [Lachnospiraceae bacterium]|jgi:trk system potassium uptake protein TrkA|nr:Trk system potassium transporter TrkA [Lachnospiraceae bacterium]